jgi:hypothetical protein
MKKNNSVNPRLAMKRICSVTVLSFGLFFLESGKASDCPKQILDLPLPNFEFKDGLGDRGIFEYAISQRDKFFWAELWKRVSIVKVTLEKVVVKKDSRLLLGFHIGNGYDSYEIKLKQGTYFKKSFQMSEPILNGERFQDLAVGVNQGDADIFGLTLHLDTSKLSNNTCKN